MIEIPKELTDEAFDAFFFLPGETDDSVHLESVMYKNPGDSVGGSSLGDGYHVILFRESDDGELVDVEQFNAVFIDPVAYITRMLEINWFGIMARMTTTSEKFIQTTFDKLKNT